jgi:hypothetical protein
MASLFLAYYKVITAIKLQRVYDQDTLPSDICQLSLRTRNRYVRSKKVSLQMILLCRVTFHVIEECRHVGGRSLTICLNTTPFGPFQQLDFSWTWPYPLRTVCALVLFVTVSRTTCSPSATPSELSHSVMPLFTSSMLDHAGVLQLLPLGQ